MMKHYRGLVPCLMQERHKNPGVSEMSVDFVVRGTGKVTAVKVNGQRGGSFANCVLGRMPTFPQVQRQQDHRLLVDVDALAGR